VLAPLRRVIVFVADVQLCATFYRTMFGFREIPSSYPPSEWAELDAGGCKLAFHKAHGPEGPIESPTGSSADPHKLAFFAEDVVAVRSALVAAGVRMDGVLRYGDLVLCHGHDPEGHIFQITNRS